MEPAALVAKLISSLEERLRQILCKDKEKEGSKQALSPREGAPAQHPWPSCQLQRRPSDDYGPPPVQGPQDPWLPVTWHRLLQPAILLSQPSHPLPTLLLLGGKLPIHPRPPPPHPMAACLLVRGRAFTGNRLGSTSTTTISTTTPSLRPRRRWGRRPHRGYSASALGAQSITATRNARAPQGSRAHAQGAVW